jgi:hypothetical protein
MENNTTQPAEVIEDETPNAEDAFATDGLPADPAFWQGYEEWVDDCERMRDALAFAESEFTHDGRQG